MRIIATEVFCGASPHAPLPAIRLILDLGGLADRTPSSLGARFLAAIGALLPGICGSKDDPLETAGAGFARLLAEIVLDLQRQLGAGVGYCRVEPLARAGQYSVICELWDDGVARPAAPLALELLERAIAAAAPPSGAGAFDPGAERERVLARLRPHALDLITMAIVREAVRRGMPWYRLVPMKPFVQLGQGSRQKHIRESATQHTSSTGRYLSKDKNATNALLARIGIPVPAQRMVTTVEDALDAAEALGYPVVTKPLDRGNGKGVSVGLRDAQALRWGFGEAAKYGEQVIVERFVAGEDHRILVIDGRMVAAAKRIPGHVVGDGERTIAELVDRTNADPRRGREYDKVMVRLEFDAQAEQVLGEAGYTRDSIPARGQVVALRRTANVSTGGTCEDVTERVHPDNRDAAIRAARVLGLNIAGVDFLSTDITRSYRESGGGICEVNFSPGLRPHWNANPNRDVVGPIVDTMFPPNAASRIPLAAVMGDRHGADACRLAAHLFAAGGRTVGSATSDGLAIGPQLAVAGDTTGIAGARTLLFDPAVDAAVLECTAMAICTQGLPFDRCDAVAILGPIDGAEQAAAARILIASAEGAVIASAEAADRLDALSRLDAGRLVLTAAGRAGQALGAHLARGGRAVIAAGADAKRRLDLYAGERCVLELAVAGSLVPGAPGGTGPESLSAAVALAWALAGDPEDLRAALTAPAA